MLAPREWRVETSEEFDRDRARIGAEATRLDAHERLWRFYLERRPFQSSHGLTSASDEQRVITSAEALDGIEYVVGLSVDRRSHVVTLQWLDTAPLHDDR